jgi:hypothetical protein
LVAALVLDSRLACADVDATPQLTHAKLRAGADTRNRGAEQSARGRTARNPKPEAPESNEPVSDGLKSSEPESSEPELDVAPRAGTVLLSTRAPHAKLRAGADRGGPRPHGRSRAASASASASA